MPFAFGAIWRSSFRRERLLMNGARKRSCDPTNVGRRMTGWVVALVCRMTRLAVYLSPRMITDESESARDPAIRLTSAAG